MPDMAGFTFNAPFPCALALGATAPPVPLTDGDILIVDEYS
jgi:hypothetical protein